MMPTRAVRRSKGPDRPWMARCFAHVAREGGASFFLRQDWENQLRQLTGRHDGALVESEADHARAVETELDRGRAVLNDRLHTNTVNHACLPWGVSSAGTAE